LILGRFPLCGKTLPKIGLAGHGKISGISIAIEGFPMKRAVLYLRVSTRDQTTANQARFRREQVAIAGKATAWTRAADCATAPGRHPCDYAFWLYRVFCASFA
jgi:hypothetical protein